MKRIYNSPNVEVVGLKLEKICDVINQGSDNDDWAKENKEDIVEDEDPELVVPIKDKWEDLSEKKIGK